MLSIISSSSPSIATPSAALSARTRCLFVGRLSSSSSLSVHHKTTNGFSLMAFYLSGLWCDYLLMTETPTVKKPASDAAHTKALFSVASSHSRFCVCPSARREFTEVFVLIQTLHFITVQFWDGTVVSVKFTVEIRGAPVYVFKLNIFSTSLSVRLPMQIILFFSGN